MRFNNKEDEEKFWVRREVWTCKILQLVVDDVDIERGKGGGGDKGSDCRHLPRRTGSRVLTHQYQYGGNVV